MDVIDFAQNAPEISRRRLADLPDRVVEGDPQHESQTFFTSEDGKMFSGSWTSTPGKWHAFADKDEYCHIISGKCALISEDGNRWEFGPGASFMIPNGFRGYWEIIETTTKHFVVRQY